MAYDKTDPNLFNHGFSTEGVVLLAADAKSHDKLIKWHHAATAVLPWYQQEYKDQQHRILALLKEKDKVAVLEEANLALRTKLARVRARLEYAIVIANSPP